MHLLVESASAILIVDYDASVRDVLYDLFADWHVCHVAGTAERALAYLAEENYDVILTDISMPGLSGVELLGRVSQSHPGVRVIVISGIDDEGHARGLLGLGASAYVAKPFRLEEVERAVAGALNSRT